MSFLPSFGDTVFSESSDESYSYSSESSSSSEDYSEDSISSEESEGPEVEHPKWEFHRRIVGLNRS